jgi:hypothetical protein
MSIVLRGGLGTGNISNERFSVTFQHHNNMKTLRESALVVGCSICRALSNELEKREELDVTADTDIAIQAELTYLEDHDNLAFRRGSGDSTILPTRLHTGEGAAGIPRDGDGESRIPPSYVCSQTH